MCSSDPKVNLGEEADKTMQAFTRNYPQMAQAISGGMLPLSQASMEATKQTYPQLQELGLKTDLGSIKGTGGELLDSAIGQDQKLNPEFYKSKADTSNALSDLFKSVDLSGGLSGSERAEIERGNNRANVAGGNTSPTGVTAVSNAMNFGQAAQAKKLAEQGVMTGAVNAGAGFLPASKSSMDPFQIATGRSSQPTTAPGAAMSASLGGQLSGTTSGLESSAMDANASRRSGMEKFLEAMPSYSG